MRKEAKLRIRFRATNQIFADSFNKGWATMQNLLSAVKRGRPTPNAHVGTDARAFLTGIAAQAGASAGQ